MKAICRIRRDPWYRRGAFEAGLQKVGFKLVDSVDKPAPGDVLCLWNRMGQDQPDADQWEAQGGTVIVAENGFIGKDAEGRQLYAISVHGHCGSGWFPASDEDRFPALNVELKPMRPIGDGHVLICGQRGLGSRQMASPQRWEDNTFARLKDMGVKNLRVRRHPGRVLPTVKLEDDIADASIVAVWSSACGVKALTLGVPVAYFAPHWICSEAAYYGVGTFAPNSTPPPIGEERRAKALRHMADGQWRVEEIEAGIPFARILEHRAEATW